MERYDLVVIGCGPAGERGAAKAAYFKKRVLVVERGVSPGGAMVHTGTLASKSLRESALAISGLRQKGLFGVELGIGRMPTIEELGFGRSRVAQDETRRIRGNIARHGIDYAEAEASFTGPNTLRLRSANGDSREVEAAKVLIATGSAPVQPEGFDFTLPEICDSDLIVRLERIPHSMVVIGAGVIGAEYASIFAAIGVKVFLVDGRARALPFLDLEVGERLTRELHKMGVQTRFNTKVDACRHLGANQLELDLSDGQTLQTECVLVAAGRTANVESLNLEAAGVKTGRRNLIAVNERYRTSNPDVHAAGDCIGFPALASTSMEQARVAVDDAFTLDGKIDLGKSLPYGIYTIPECSFVGPTEEELVTEGVAYVVGRSELSDNGRGKIMGETGFIKLLVDAESRCLLAAHIVGERASELVHVAQAHMDHNAKIDVYIDQVFNYPTLGESFKYAAYDALGKLAILAAEKLDRAAP